MMHGCETHDENVVEERTRQEEVREKYMEIRVLRVSEESPEVKILGRFITTRW